MTVRSGIGSPESAGLAGFRYHPQVRRLCSTPQNVNIFLTPYFGVTSKVTLRLQNMGNHGSRKRNHFLATPAQTRNQETHQQSLSLLALNTNTQVRMQVCSSRLRKAGQTSATPKNMWLGCGKPSKQDGRQRVTKERTTSHDYSSRHNTNILCLKKMIPFQSVQHHLLTFGHHDGVSLQAHPCVLRSSSHAKPMLGLP